MTTPLPRISVVIPAYNEQKFLPACLDALTRQDHTEDWEVIVVDNRSTDKTSAIARSYEDRLPITVIQEEQPGRGAARQKGFAQARGEILLSTDADAQVPPDWISTMTGMLDADPQAVGVTGSAKVTDCSPFQNWLFTGIFSAFLHVGHALTGFVCLNGFNFAVRRSAYEKSGGFDRHNDAQEDMELTIRVRKLGKILLAPVSPVVSGRRFQRGVLRALYEYSSTFIQKFVFGKRRVLLSNVK